jgi:hypothetical protein
VLVFDGPKWRTVPAEPKDKVFSLEELIKEIFPKAFY